MRERQIGRCGRHVLTRMREAADEPERLACEISGFAGVDLADIARAFGCIGIRVEDPTQLPGVLGRALAAERPVVIDAVTDWRAVAPEAWTGG